MPKIEGRMGATTEMKVTAFGVTKTISEWEMDSRAAVYGELIVRRIEGGMTPERAISTPTVEMERGPTRYMAWGERKTLRDWADDPRCRTSYANLKGRISDGWDVIPALETPTLQRQPRPVTAWDETKSLRAWSLDERAGASYSVIQKRLEEGWEPERAISEGADHKIMVLAWGETKCVADWGRDARCVVLVDVIRERLRAGCGARRRRWTEPSRERDRVVTAFGETKRLSEWFLDPRCTVDGAGFSGRIARGFSNEQALTEPIQGSATLTAWGETKRLTRWLEDARCVVGRQSLEKRLGEGMTPELALSTPHKPQRHAEVTAWGESKRLVEWVEDARCSVSRHLISKRLRDGWDAEEAIGQPLLTSPVPVTAFGETKILTEWEQDPRARARSATISKRIADGMDPQEAISTPSQKIDRNGLTAFGEWKTYQDWERDPRATVGGSRIAERVRKGMSPEEAITRKSHLTGVVMGPRKGSARGVTAFGETKSVHEWAEDPRCVPNLKVLRGRLFRGTPPEEALTAELKPRVSPVVEAFGEKKTLAEWGQDRRSGVQPRSIKARLEKGWSVEEAITTPEDPSKAGGPREAFGEWKTLREWAEDGRSAVTWELLTSRLYSGWSLEEAITVPVGALKRRIVRGEKRAA